MIGPDVSDRLFEHRRQMLENPNIRVLHDNAAAYAKAVDALEQVRGGPLSTTLEYLIHMGFLVPVPIGMRVEATYNGTRRVFTLSTAGRWQADDGTMAYWVELRDRKLLGEPAEDRSGL